MNAKEKSVLQLSEEQRAIVEASGNIAVVAGAGTGKTETLTQRVLHALASQREYSLRELVVLTFTDKAAGEMRQRIYRNLLLRLLQETDDAARSRWSSLCAGFAETHRIETFDAFNHRLLSAYPEYQNAPNFFVAMSDYDLRKLSGKMARAFWDWLESLENDAPEREDFFGLLENFDRRQILQLLELLAQESATHRAELAALPDAGNYQSELRALAARFATLLHRREARRLNRLWQRYRTVLQAHFSKLPPQIAEVLSDPQQLRPRDSTVLTKSGTFRKKWIPASCAEICSEIEEQVFPFLSLWQKAEMQLHEALQTLADPQQTWENDWRVRVQLARAARLSRWWANKREEICRREGWLDFLAAQRAALSLVEENSEIAARLRAGCRMILVDEFQDTNFEQWRLVQAFAAADNVMLIGDGKQSIYGFRGGDITVFDEVRSDILGIESPHSLSLSQRATPALTQFFNEVFEDVLPHENDPDRQPWEAPFQELHSARAGDANSDVFILEATQKTESEQPENECESEDSFYETNAATQPFSFRAPRELELLAEATALLLREIQDDADGNANLEEQTATLQRPEFKTISAAIRAKKPATIGVLFSTHWAKAIYETKFRQHGVRYASVKGIGFFKSQPVYDAINLLRFFFDARDDLALSGVLRSPFFGASDIALLELHRFQLQSGATSLWSALCHRGGAAVPERFLLEDDDERAFSRAQELLSRWLGAAQTELVSAVLERCLRETEIAFALELDDDAAQQSENWYKVLEMIRERESGGQGSARALAEFLSDQSQSEEREAEAELPEGGAIQLMTIFAAKGLGFDMTIVAQMDGSFRFDEELLRRGEIENRNDKWFALNFKDDEGNEQKNLVWEILKENDRAKSEAEWARLFYVACTRARNFLLLAMPQEPSPTTWAEMAAPFVENKTRFQLSELRERALVRAQNLRDKDIARAQTVPPPPEINVEVLRPLPGNSFGIETSVTQLTQSLKAGSTPGGSYRAREHGILFHRLLRAGVAANDHARIASFLSTTNVSGTHVEILSRQLQAAHVWLSEQKFDLSRARHEVAFSVSAAALAGVLPAQSKETRWINGVIDLLIPCGNEWAIVDFKTHLSFPQVAKEARLQYEVQLRLYRAAAEFLGRRVSECWLVCVEENGVLAAQRVE
jgi:ATP-dependent helicase/nuclease subunit A